MRKKDSELMERILAYIDRFYMENQRIPTQRIVAEEFKISPSMAHRYLTEMGEKNMIRYEGRIAGTERIDKYSAEFVSTPIVGSIQCGDPIGEEEFIEEYVSLPASIFGKGEHYILRARGRSMVDAGIYPGDLVVICRQQMANIGDIVVALDDENQNTLKRFGGFDQQTKKAILLYENRAEYSGQKILVDNLVVQGVARHVIRAL